MTALAEALLAAQRQAIGALAKAYVAGAFEDDGDAGLIANLDRIGATDAVEQNYLRECLDTLRTWGAPSPRPTGNGASERPPKPMSAAQRARIERDCKDRNLQPPDFDAVPLTLEQASTIIDSISDGTYDAARWNPPF